MNAPPAGTKKHKLGRLLGGSSSSQPNDERPAPRAQQTDSAYASSDNANNDIIQVENDGSIPNTHKGQHLSLDRGTGEVYDEDTGEVVTVVTTTTTTTTTTTRSGGGRPHQDVQRDVQTTQHQQPQGQSISTTTGAGGPAQYVNQPSRDSTYASGGSGLTAPDIPARNSRRSGEYDAPNYPAGSSMTDMPTSPSRHNFSYPGRNPPNPPAATETGYTPQQEAQAKRTGRFADLKAAAIGLHGVGETLRGTLNSTIDQQYPSHNPNKAAAAQARNAAVLERGKNEMGRIPTRRQQPADQISGYGGSYTNQYQADPMSSHGGGYNNQYQAEPMSSHGGSYNPQHGTGSSHGSLPPDPNTNLKGNAVDGSHSAVFGLTPDGHRHLDTRSPTPPQQHTSQGTNDLSSVSDLANNSCSAVGQAPPRGTMGRSDSGTAPETITGNVERNVERVPTMRHPAPGTNQAAAMSGEEVVSPVSPDGGVKKQGTFSKLFKRKPVGGSAEKKSYY